MIMMRHAPVPSVQMLCNVLIIRKGELMRHVMHSVRNFTDKFRTDWAIYVLGVSRAVTIGVAYIMVRGIPGLTSSFVAIFVALLAFDLMIAAPSLKPRQIDIPALVKGTIQALEQTVRSLGKGL